MIVEAHASCDDFNSYRAARVKSLFNAESGANFDISIECSLPETWSIGVIVGPSGSGKTSIGKTLFGGGRIYDQDAGWSDDRPIIDDISPEGDFNEVCDVLSAVGLGSVPSWLRPYRVLSNGEKFRASLARLILDGDGDAVVDEFTSVVDRQIAKIGSLAFQKKWRKLSGRRVVLLTPHYDVLDWLQPDWVIDTADRTFVSGWVRPRPEIALDVVKTNGSYWHYFKTHYYLDLPMPVGAEYFVGTVNGELCCHMAVCPKFQTRTYRGTRLVTMPEWQGVGIATRFLNYVAAYHMGGHGRGGHRYPIDFHTSHPGLCDFFRASPDWTQISAVTHGGSKASSAKSIAKANRKHGKKGIGSGYGGHLRAIQGFRYIGGAL